VFDDVEENRFGQTQTEYKSGPSSGSSSTTRRRSPTPATTTSPTTRPASRTARISRSSRSNRCTFLRFDRRRNSRSTPTPTSTTRQGVRNLSRVTDEDGIHRCVHCDTSGVDETYTYCPNCGAIACNSHTKTERLEGEPVCTGCAVTERFALKMKYFYDEDNLEAFREEYAAMPLHEKAMENKLLAGGSVVATLLLLVVGLLVIGGII